MISNLIIVAVILGIGFGVWSSYSAGSEQSKATLRQTGKCFRPVAGESSYVNALSTLAGGRKQSGLGLECMATLICEEDNRFDANAVRVDISGKTVGYLMPMDAEEYRRRMQAAGRGAQAERVAARISGGGDGRHYGVWLDLPDRIV